MDQPTLTQQMIDIGRRADQRGWVPASGGNFSARLTDREFLITASGRHKGRLGQDGFLRINASGDALDIDRKPSYETGLHTAIYRDLPDVAAVLHFHGPYSLALAAVSGREILLSNQELLKIFPGISTHAASMRIPVLENDQDIPRLAEQASVIIRESPGCSAYLIRGHGMYTWAADLAQAELQAEGLESMCQVEILKRSVEG